MDSSAAEFQDTDRHHSFSNARSTSKGPSWRHLRTSPKFNWLPWQRPLGDRQMNIGIIIPTNMPTKPLKSVKIGPGYSEIFDDMPIFAVSPQKVLLLTA